MLVKNLQPLSHTGEPNERTKNNLLKQQYYIKTYKKFFVNLSMQADQRIPRT